MDEYSRRIEDRNWLEIRRDLKELRHDIQHIQRTTTKLDTELTGLKEHVTSLRESLTTSFVTKEAFSPVRNFVYGTVAVLLSGLVTTLFALLAAN